LCLKGQNNEENKDCPCLQYQVTNGPRNYDLTVIEVINQQRFIAAIVNSVPAPPNEQGGTYLVGLFILFTKKL
jgi:hypothetical protein